MPTFRSECKRLSKLYHLSHPECADVILRRLRFVVAGDGPNIDEEVCPLVCRWDSAPVVTPCCTLKKTCSVRVNIVTRYVRYPESAYYM